jgi:hypothetical protein
VRNPFRRGQEAFDPFADAADRMDRARQARDEVGDPTVDSPLGFTPMGRPWGRWVWIFAVLALVVGIATSTSRARAPSLAADCKRTVVKLSATEGRFGSPVTWKATGPSGNYALTLDVTAVSRGNGRSVNVVAGGSASWAGPVFAMSGCRATGRFGLTLPPGDHTMRLFRFSSGAVGPVTKAVVTQAVSITR